MLIIALIVAGIFVWLLCMLATVIKAYRRDLDWTVALVGVVFCSTSVMIACILSNMKPHGDFSAELFELKNEITQEEISQILASDNDFSVTVSSRDGEKVLFVERDQLTEPEKNLDSYKYLTRETESPTEKQSFWLETKPIETYSFK